MRTRQGSAGAGDLSAPAAGAPPQASGPRLLVAIPALDEERTVGDVIRRIPAVPGVGAVETLVVDDGSVDETSAKAAEAGASVLRHAVTRGLGASFHTALAYCIESGADLIVTIDADGQFDPADIPALVEPVAAGEADFATASRFKDPALTPRMPAIKRWGNRMMSWWISRLAGQRFHDVSCGMRCYSRDAALRLHLIGQFTYTQEVFLNLAFKGMRIVEVPIRVRGEREHGRSRVAASLWRYGFRTTKIILRAYRDFKPLRFFGGLAAVFLAAAAGLGAFFLWHYLTTGAFSPHLWSGFSAGACLGLSLLMFHMGMIGDMLTRHRIYLEEILFRQRAEATRRAV